MKRTSWWDFHMAHSGHSDSTRSLIPPIGIRSSRRFWGDWNAPCRRRPSNPMVRSWGPGALGGPSKRSTLRSEMLPARFKNNNCQKNSRICMDLPKIWSTSQLHEKIHQPQPPHQAPRTSEPGPHGRQEPPSLAGPGTAGECGASPGDRPLPAVARCPEALAENWSLAGGGDPMGCWYPLVNIQKTMENHHF